MLNRAPYNIEVPEFSPSRDAPINSYIVRKYQCQEQLAGQVNKFRSLTWKIQQPDSSLVWQSVKIVLPMAIQVVNSSGDVSDMNVYSRLPVCNLALSQSPMNAFEQTTLSLNGRIFSEVNAFRDVLDTCYRGIGAQAYGDNHSLKPIVQRNVFNGALEQNGILQLVDTVGRVRQGHYVQTNNLEERTVDSAFSLLEHNGPFIERARIFQDQLSFDGKTWTGEISHLLELGPFQARARKGNTAVPYIKDFHLRLNFKNNPSHFDVKNPAGETVHGAYTPLGGRTMAPKLLEFATLPNFLHHGEQILSLNGWPCDFSFTYTEKPYLEITYTKHESGMRPFYNLRCFEHQYEQSPRFTLDPPMTTMESPTSLQRVTTRLLSLPTKVYVWADLADEYKHSFISGGVRRSCLLENLHLRVNQRPDVMFNPSQEECYEMFRRHTNSSLEYGSWLKSPIYCFDMVDIGQSDMYSNDARVTWMEWDAQASLTQLQLVENRHLKELNILEAHCYGTVGDTTPSYWADGWDSQETTGIHLEIDAQNTPVVSDDTVDIALSLSFANTGEATAPHVLAYDDAPRILGVENRFNDEGQVYISSADLVLNTNTAQTFSLDGYIWGKMCILTHTSNSVTKPKYSFSGPLFYVPEGYRFIPDVTDTGQMWNLTDGLTWTYSTVHDEATFTWNHAAHGDPHKMSGVLQDNPRATGQNGKRFGSNGDANWCPGFWGYEIDADGIRNLHGDTYSRGGVKTDGNSTYVKNADHVNYAWIAFAYRSGFPTPGPGKNTQAAVKWAHWRSDVAVPGNGMAQNPPAYWADQTANYTTDWGNGFQKAHIRGKGQFGAHEKQVFSNKVTRTDEPYGFKLTKALASATSIAVTEEYRLKVLYEYGNCQYQFSADASPTKVLPNLVPVQ